MDWCQNDRAAGMDRHIDLIADFDAGQIHQSSVKDDALGISHLRNGLGHGVILCFTPLKCQPRAGSRKIRKVRKQKGKRRSRG
jgi:hypothetical protein